MCHQICGILVDLSHSSVDQLRAAGSTKRHADTRHSGFRRGVGIPHRIADEHGARRRPGLAVDTARAVDVESVVACSSFIAAPDRPGGFAEPLRFDVLIDVEQIAGIVRALDLDQAVVVLAIVVLDLVVVVVLHEVDIAAGL